MITRRTFFKYIGGMVASGLSLGTYAFAVEPGFLLNLTNHRVTPNNWPAGFKLKIAVLADIHMGEPQMPLGRLEKIIDLTNAQNPDLIVLVGDYLASHRFVTKRVSFNDTAQICSKLKAPLGRYAIQGNHDWWEDETAQVRGHGPTTCQRAFEGVGIPVLENGAIKLTHQSKPFWLLGLGDQKALLPRRAHRLHRANQGRTIKGVDDLKGTLSSITDDAPAILLAHEPDIFPEVPKRIALTISGHTHGGQVNLFGWTPIVASRFGSRFAYGHIIEDNHHLVVSGGLGCSVLPVRFGRPPEIVMVTLGEDAPRS